MHTVKKDQLGWVPVANASSCGMLSRLATLVDPEAALPRVNWNSLPLMCVRSILADLLSNRIAACLQMLPKSAD